MPELPEVEVVRRGLVEHVVGRTIEDAQFHGNRVVRRHLPGAEDLSSRLRSNAVHSARRRGKYLWLVLETPRHERQALIAHLGMSGQLLVQPADAPDERHLRARFTFTDGGPQLRFVDQRTFGGMALDELAPDDVPELIAHIAPDLLEDAFDQGGVVVRLKARESAVKRALLDQTLLSGVGNIYADEALWRAGVHGERFASSLTKPSLSRIIDHAREVMTEALDHGGTSFDALYVNVNGAPGYFERSLCVYGQEGRPCRRCSTLIRRDPFMNRSSYYCPRCQPAPRPTAR